MNHSAGHSDTDIVGADAKVAGVAAEGAAQGAAEGCAGQVDNMMVERVQPPVAVMEAVTVVEGGGEGGNQTAAVVDPGVAVVEGGSDWCRRKVADPLVAIVDTGVAVMKGGSGKVANPPVAVVQRGVAAVEGNWEGEELGSRLRRRLGLSLVGGGHGAGQGEQEEQLGRGG